MAITFEIKNYLTPGGENGFTVYFRGLSENQWNAACKAYYDVMESFGKRRDSRDVFALSGEYFNVKTGDQATALVKAFQKEGFFIGDAQHQKYENGIPALVSLEIQKAVSDLNKRISAKQ